MSERVTVIVNPAAGRGRGAQVLGETRAAFAQVGVRDVRLTTGPRQETLLARQALDEGATTLVAVGGDGTWSNVAHAILESGADCRLALLAAGTGNDFAKTVGAPARDVAATARLATSGPDQRVDVGRIEGRTFLNVSGFGFDIAVLEDVGKIPWLKGSALYLYSALRQILRYGGISIDIASPARSRGDARHLMLIVANARCFGGSFQIAPQASLVDGKLDAIAILDAPPLGRLKLLGAAGKGTHVTMPGVVTEQAASFRLRFHEPPGYETDGEYHLASSDELEIRCMPAALRVVTEASLDYS